MPSLTNQPRPATTASISIACFPRGRPAFDHPADAFSADTLGTERAGNGSVIDDGLVLTIGYLITEAEAVWLHLGDGRVVEGHCARLRFRERLRPGAGARPHRFSIRWPLVLRRLPKSATAWCGRRAARAHAGRLPATSPRNRSSPVTGSICWTRRSSPIPRTPIGAAPGLISRPRRMNRHRLAATRARARRQGRACQHDRADRSAQAGARRFAQVRPCQQAGAALLGMYTTEIDNRVVVIGLRQGPAGRAELKAGERFILAVKGRKISSQTPSTENCWRLRTCGRRRAAHLSP